MEPFEDWSDVVDWAHAALSPDVEVAVPVAWPRDVVGRWILVWRTQPGPLFIEGYVSCGGDARFACNTSS
jgi:hypothetical protein